MSSRGEAAAADDAIHVRDPRCPSLTLCEQDVRSLNVVAADSPVIDWWAGCWTCIDARDQAARVRSEAT